MRFLLANLNTKACVCNGGGFLAAAPSEGREEIPRRYRLRGGLRAAVLGS